MAYEAGSLVPEVYNAGDVHHMKRGVVKQYSASQEMWALEYAQGEFRWSLLTPESMSLIINL